MKKIVNGFWQAIDWFLCIGTIVMVLLIFINIIARYFFNYTFVSFEEIARILFVWGSYLGSAVAMKDGTHITVDILINALPGKSRTVIDIISNLIVDAILVLTINVLIPLIKMNIANPLPLTRIPYGVVQMVIPFSMTVMVIVNLFKLVALFKKLFAEKKGDATV